MSDIVSQYMLLKDRGQQIFDGLRDLPQFGKRLWEPYFRRAFDIYHKLWKFQQEHRSTLEAEYGLQRHEIGEIACRIGQLYYQFYLRKGDTCYLDEAYVFYEAIRARQYLGISCPGVRVDPRVVLRRLRYYVRFCAVCLLMGRRGLLLQLLTELDSLASQNQCVLSETDRAEWSRVLSEFHSFVQVESPLMVTQATPSFSTQPRSEHEVTVEVQRRLRYEFVQAQALVLQGSAAIARVEPLALRDAVLVGSRASQLRFNELPLDVFRMLHALEWEPSSLQAPHPGVFAAAGPQPVAAAASAVVAATATAGTPATAQGSERVHPHKYVLHRATAAQVALVLATAMIELPPGGALLLYLSSDGLHAPPSETSISCAAGGSSEEAGHHKLATETPFRRGGVGLAVDAAERETCCLRPADLCPFCRMPLVLVVESDNAAAFRVLPHAAATTSSSPLLCLLAARSGTAGAVQCPQLAGGGLLTFFLHDPIAAFCLLGGVAQVPHAMHKKLATMLLHSFTQTTRALIACPETPTACLAFLSDPFLRTLILRFIFCHSTLRLFKPNRTLQLPESVPPMPSAVMLHDTTLGAVRQLAAIAGVVSQFHPTPLP